MGNVSYSAHISNGKSAITSKKALAGVAKHNLRKYKSADYSSDNIRLIYGTTDLFQDVKRVYHREFDDVVKEYNSRQKREDRKIKDYFEHVAGLNQDMAVEIIFQCGDKKYWDEHWKNKNYMSEVFDYILECLQKLLPEFKIANAVIHFDEASPHMHVVGIPVWEGAKRGLSKKVSKRNVFTPQTLSVILQDKLRAEASYGFECYFKEQLAEKKKGRNHDLSVTEYKVAQESRKLTDIKQQNNEEQEKNTKLRSNNASISYQIATQEQRHSRNLDVIAADEDRLETVRSSINAAETEYAKYADNYYGTPLESIEKHLNNGEDVILVIEIQGALQIKEILPDTLFIFILPPTMKELKRRLENRGTEDKAKIDKRFLRAYEEINEVSKYNYVVVNDDLDVAAKKVEAILISEKCRVDRIESIDVDNIEEKIHEALIS